MNERNRMRMMEYARGREQPESRNRRRYSNGRFAPRGYGEDPGMYDEPYNRRGGNRMMAHYGDPGKEIKMMGNIGFHEQEEEGMPWEIAEEWVNSMATETGKPKWSYEQVESLAKKHKCECDTVELWAVMNALHSDYCKVLRKYGVDSVNLYLELAVAWLEDEDAVENKAMAYYEYIVAK